MYVKALILESMLDIILDKLTVMAYINMYYYYIYRCRFRKVHTYNIQSCIYPCLSFSLTKGGLCEFVASN